MSKQDTGTTVGQLLDTTGSTAGLPVVLTRVVWLLWVASTGVTVARLGADRSWELSGLVAVDGLTLVLWVAVTLLSGIVHSYSRRYMAGSRQIRRFFAGLFGFTLVVMVLVAADHIALFASAWLMMGLVMADLIGTVQGWPQAQVAASHARRYFILSSALLGIGLATLWWTTGATSISAILDSTDTVSGTTRTAAAGALLLAAMVQSALVPFHTWLLSSMTAPTPASALMHAGFVNAGGVLLVRFAPVVSVDERFMLLVVVVGAFSALCGKLLKSVQTDIKGQLGCSTTGQMGFMILQAGLGYFGAALTHLVLHGFYKAYLFLSSGSRVERTSPAETRSGSDDIGALGGLVTLVTGVAGGVLFAVLTGKGNSLDSGVLLTGLVVVTTLHATRQTVGRTAISPGLRYGAVVLVFLPAIALYAGVYLAVTGLLDGTALVSTPADLTLVHVAVALVFALAYVAIELELYQHSRRLYVGLLNATQPPSGTLLTATEEYSER